MQVRAIIEAAVRGAPTAGVEVQPEIMIPLVAHARGARRLRALVDRGGRRRCMPSSRARRSSTSIGTMIELPRAALTRRRDRASTPTSSRFGTNDLTQMTLRALARRRRQVPARLRRERHPPDDPFVSIDEDGVGAADRDRRRARAAHAARTSRSASAASTAATRRSIAFCHQHGLDYVSCSPFRVPIARLAAAQAAAEAADAPEAAPEAAVRRALWLAGALALACGLGCAGGRRGAGARRLAGHRAGAGRRGRRILRKGVARSTGASPAAASTASRPTRTRRCAASSATRRPTPTTTRTSTGELAKPTSRRTVRSRSRCWRCSSRARAAPVSGPGSPARTAVHSAAAPCTRAQRPLGAQ